MNSRTILLAAGGTGGHIFPAEALAEALRARGFTPVLVTDLRFYQYRQGRDDNSLLSHIPVQTIRAGSLSGGFFSRLIGAWNILRGILEARRLIKEIEPAAIIGFGGYPSFPTMVAAVLLGRVTLIHEQNSVLGKANRVLATRVRHIGTTYGKTRQLPAGAKVTVTGNPVRAAIRALNDVEYPVLPEGGMMRILITGGSQGAAIFSEILPAAIRLLDPKLRARIRLDQQVRAQEIDAVREHYASMGLQADIAPFFTDMAARLAAAHLVVCRSGASTMAELMVAGRPAIFIPLPTAADNHQYYNAQAVEDSGAGWVITQEAFTPQVLATRLETLLATPDRLSEAASAMHAMGIPDAADQLADLVLETAGLNGVQSVKEAA